MGLSSPGDSSPWSTLHFTYSVDPDGLTDFLDRWGAQELHHTFQLLIGQQLLVDRIFLLAKLLLTTINLGLGSLGPSGRVRLRDMVAEAVSFYSRITNSYNECLVARWPPPRLMGPSLPPSFPSPSFFTPVTAQRAATTLAIPVPVNPADDVAEALPGFMTMFPFFTRMGVLLRA